MEPMTATASKLLAASAVSRHYDTRTAALDLVNALGADLSAAGGCDLMVLFASYHHRTAFADAAAQVRAELSPRGFIGVTAESVVAGNVELEGLAGMAAIGLRLPGATVTTFSVGHGDSPAQLTTPEFVKERFALGGDRRATILLADPFTTPVPALLQAVNAAAEGQNAPLVGGMASGASQPGQNVLIVDDRAQGHGAVGLSIHGGDFEVDVLVSQGCRPIGAPLVVTKVTNNILLELGGKPALIVAQEMAGTLPESQRKMLSKGVFAGIVINEYKDRFGRGDFLIRNILGADRRLNGLVVNDQLRVGQTIQFHVRDADTAREDLQLLLDVEQLKPQAAGVMLFTCNGRGSRLFQAPNQDASAFATRLNNPALAGFFAAGEIGPIGGKAFLHGHTACAAVFRPRTA
jgi:small ligand-binding sensory domain FIST